MVVGLLRRLAPGLCALVALLVVELPTVAHAATITVTTSADELTNNGQCSLREAIRNANADSAVQPDCIAGSGADTITLPAGTYRLTIGGTGNNAGDLDLTASVTISGAGPERTIVDGTAMSPRDRVIDVAA